MSSKSARFLVTRVSPYSRAVAAMIRSRAREFTRLPWCLRSSRNRAQRRATACSLHLHIGDQADADALGDEVVDQLAGALFARQVVDDPVRIQQVGHRLGRAGFRVLRPGPLEVLEQFLAIDPGQGSPGLLQGSSDALGIVISPDGGRAGDACIGPDLNLGYLLATIRDRPATYRHHHSNVLTVPPQYAGLLGTPDFLRQAQQLGRAADLDMPGSLGHEPYLVSALSHGPSGQARLALDGPAACFSLAIRLCATGPARTACSPVVHPRTDLCRWAPRVSASVIRASLALIGSVARGEAGPDSDVDLLIEILRPMGFFGFFAIQERIEQILGRPVDLVTPGALKPRIKGRVLQEAMRATSRSPRPLRHTIEP
jgi:predicted nucleotidyltransferase